MNTETIRSYGFGDVVVVKSGNLGTVFGVVTDVSRMSEEERRARIADFPGLKSFENIYWVQINLKRTADFIAVNRFEVIGRYVGNRFEGNPECPDLADYSAFREPDRRTSLFAMKRAFGSFHP